MNRYTTTFLVCVFSFFSCKEVKKKTNYINESTTVVKMDKIIEKPFEELVKDNYFIILETTENNQISSVSDLFITQNLIFVGDKLHQGIFVFSYPEGKFIREIDHFGRGPEEYSKMNDLSVNNEFKYLEVLDSNLKKILRYDFKGKYISTTKIPFWGAMEFTRLSEETVLLSQHIQNTNLEKPYELITINDSKVKEKFIKIENVPSIAVGSSNRLKLINGEVFYKPLFSPFIFEVNDKEIQCKYYFDFGDEWVSDDLLSKKFKDGKAFVNKCDNEGKVIFFNGTEGENKFIFSFRQHQKKHCVLFDTQSKVKVSISNYESGICQKNRFEFFNNGYFISIKQPDRIIEAYDKGILQSKYLTKDFVSNLTIHDNPILMFTKFR